MRLLIFRSMWGVVPSADGVAARSPMRDLRHAAEAVKALGYDGIEMPFKMVEHETPDVVRSILSEFDLKVLQFFHVFTAHVLYEFTEEHACVY